MNCAESRHLLQYKVLSSLMEAGSVVIGLMSLRRPCVHVAHAGTSGSGNTVCEAVRNAPERAQTAATNEHTHVYKIGNPNHQAPSLGNSDAPRTSAWRAYSSEQTVFHVFPRGHDRGMNQKTPRTWIGSWALSLVCVLTVWNSPVRAKKFYWLEAVITST